MTLLFYFKPNFHQGHSPGIEALPKRKRKKRKPTKRFIERTAETMELEPAEVEQYVEDVLSEEDTATLLERIGAMVKKSLEAKRKKLSMMIAQIWDWL